MMKHIGESPYHQLRTDSGRRGLGEAPMERNQNGLAEQAVQMERGRSRVEEAPPAEAPGQKEHLHLHWEGPTEADQPRW